MGLVPGAIVFRSLKGVERGIDIPKFKVYQKPETRIHPPTTGSHLRADETDFVIIRYFGRNTSILVQGTNQQGGCI